ncbi:hypothetical protein ECANGB1_1270 [Enterospora canceri]|uniref:Uncharacterized protein n=1 Tax=Enterospora canceri TaxID=1081671 RepID=A0A1Y1S741_9MICR|nr:hypothetical protein ECANGB1_1270 [Enterospora canceri]
MPIVQKQSKRKVEYTNVSEKQRKDEKMLENNKETIYRILEHEEEKQRHVDEQIKKESNQTKQEMINMTEKMRARQTIEYYRTVHKLNVDFIQLNVQETADLIELLHSGHTENNNIQDLPILQKHFASLIKLTPKKCHLSSNLVHRIRKYFK